MLEICVGMWTNRYFPASVIAEQSKVFQDSGVVDGLLIPDQLAGFIPRQLWTEEHTPIASIVRDPDSALDAFMVAPYVYAAAPKLRIHVTTDSVRRAPSELIQSMLTLAHITEGNANFQIGVGEVRQTRPFGHPQKQGVSRMIELLQIYRRMLDTDGPFDYAGKRWTFDRAFLGNANEHLPTVWGLSGGPQLIDTITSFADGIAFFVPNALSSPELVADAISVIRRQVKEKDRDPEAFRIGMWAAVLLHPDQNALERAFDNSVIRFFSASSGRVDSQQWKDEGIPLPFPPGWAYDRDLLPNNTPNELVDAILAATTREHVERSWFAGSPTDVAAQIQPYLYAGIDWVMPFDYLPVVGDPADAPAAVGWMVELCRALKEVS